MRVGSLFGCGFGLLLGSLSLARAQNTLEALENELSEAKQQHDEVTTKMLTAFFRQVDAGMASPDAAVTLYTDPLGIDGSPPTPTPIATENEHENVTEQTERQNLDKANLARFGRALQLHCGVLHFAALFALEPDKPGLQNAWVSWLTFAAPVFVQLTPPHDRTIKPPAPKADPNAPHDESDKHRLDRPPPFVPDEIKGKSVRDSLITKFLGFTACNDKDQGGWSVNDIPRFYRSSVLDPLRVKPTAATLSAWDVVIAMANATEPDSERWNQIAYPELLFDRASDAYRVAPSTESLEVLVRMIKDYPSEPKVDEWISRVHGFVDEYRASHGLRPAFAPPSAANPIASTSSPASASTAPTPPAAPTITTQQQGDMTIVTTNTNAATAIPPAH